MTKKQVGEERVYSAYTSTLLFITKGSQDWNSHRSGSRSWCRGHGRMLLTGLFPQPCSACFLIEPKTTSPGMAPPTMGWALPIWSLVEKMPYSWILWRHFPNWGFFLCDNSSLCQVQYSNAIIYLDSARKHEGNVSMRSSCKAFSQLVIKGGRPSPLWVVPSLGW